MNGFIPKHQLVHCFVKKKLGLWYSRLNYFTFIIYRPLTPDYAVLVLLIVERRVR